MKMYFLALIIGALFSDIAFAETGVTDKEILIGISNAQNGPSKFLGTQYSSGATAYFNYVNEKGGVGGRKIKVIQYDDGYEPEKCIVNTNKLIKDDNVFALFGYVGTPTSMAALPIVQKEKVPFFFPFTGAIGLRDTTQASYVFNMRGNYEKETEVMVEHLVKNGKKKIAIFYQDDSYGRAGLDGTVKALKKRGMDLTAEGTYPRNTASINNALISIKKGIPDGVIMIGTYKPCAEFIKKARKMGMKEVEFLNISFVGSKALLEELGTEGNGVLVTQVVPFPWNKNIKAVVEYQEVMKKQDSAFEPEFISFEGFLGAKLFVELVKKAGTDLTRINLISQIEETSKLDIGVGEDITFSKTDHQGMDKVFVTEIKNGKFVER